MSDRWEIVADSVSVTTWVGNGMLSWQSSKVGSFTLEGLHYEVVNTGGRYQMFCAGGGGAGFPRASLVVSGVRRWRLLGDGCTHELTRARWSSQLVLRDAAGNAVGYAGPAQFRERSDIHAELPGLSPQLQIFVVAVVVSRHSAAAG